ncbi:NAD-dependent dehydratase [Rhizobium sp. R72]|uniref:NAD-dependent epimerase/dehydratase family protein n=1 Tax=unclassified Rhizobium TaxID=2613769 RepID=UPI000B532AE9|nr:MULTISPECIES: NAD-dependent epimerase/dehydratase family protein [unclassified Rhizobium]OWV92806.1 NAD-dependent dehydratase [Rhizobium sp. R72]OWV93017.1 NAD-dependent dehydratase [Rhizobium sp. R711]
MKMTDRGERHFGFVEWFALGEHERAETALTDMLAAGARYLRTNLSWAEYVMPGGPEWFDWLLPTLAKRIDLLPCVHFTPPSLSRTGRPSGAPRVLKDYADFIDHILTRYGRYFSHVELWNEPNNLVDWDWRTDHDFLLFCEMVGGAAYWASRRGWKPVLAGPNPFDAHWLKLMGERGVLNVVAAVGLHGFPGTWESETGTWEGWEARLAQTRRVLGDYNDKAQIWITETGYSTWRNDEVEQVGRFLAAVNAPADRMYWYGWRDMAPDMPVRDGLWSDPRDYHLGLSTANNRQKLLARLLCAGGLDGAHKLLELAAPSLRQASDPIVVVGGGGFIGCNLADSYLDDGKDVIVLDNLSREGVDENLCWLVERHGDRVHPAIADIRDLHSIEPVLSDAKAVFHLAAQTAVTTSLVQPVDDFETNARGTINVLEATRKAGRNAPVVFASTNKVYGGLDKLELAELDDRYVPIDETVRRWGLDETQKLDFCTPYGCSKGAADQYVLDYARSYRIPSSGLRMSCIYGPRQFGTEDQGWVAHFLLCALRDEAISIYGNGKQVRDILHVSDAVAAYRAVMDSIDRTKGKAFNLGGGAENAVSLELMLGDIERLVGRPVKTTQGPWRAGDQLYFVSDTRALHSAVGWRAKVNWHAGVRDLCNWLMQNRVPVTRQARRASA